MNPETPFIDIDARKAAIPGTDGEPVAWTLTRDVAKFVRKMVESDQPWPKKSLVVGDTVSFNEIVRLAETARSMTAVTTSSASWLIDVQIPRWMWFTILLKTFGQGRSRRSRLTKAYLTCFQRRCC